MTKSEKLRWEQERAAGRGRYLVRTIGRAGLPFGILVTAANVLYSYLTHKPVAAIWVLAIEFGLNVLGFGALMGLWLWQNNERDYAKPTEGDDVA